MTNNYKILLVDLCKKKTKVQYVDKKISDFYMGGFGLSLWWLNENKDIENPFMVFSSSLIDFNNPINKFIILTKNKENKIKSTSMGGNFSYYLKKSSYDGLVLYKKSENPCEIFIDGDKILFNEIEISENSNSLKNKYLKEKYGEDSSSLYITKSAIRGDYLSRLIEDEYRGCSKNIGNFLLEKNVFSITVKNNNLREINTPNIFEKNKNRICKACLLGCHSKRISKRESIFSVKEIYNDNEIYKLERIKNRLDEYGIDQFGLSNAIEFSYKNLNHIYNFKNLDLDELEKISKGLVDKNRKDIYADLAKGEKYLEKKYGIEIEKKKKGKNKFKENAKIIDSAGLCLFSVDPNSLSNIAETINKISNFSYSEKDLEDLSERIEILESSLF
ncbi:aldehyde ferredoxin oxidoreductase N-terminal domain-containing protein [Anaerococcus ihuae]|uniref:aldehyde ferredoxin oxidoreductase N-terminal domain-containing protein n=1 Tax=Anaerococcus ihuae TaxID=2899519 RepID=UPI001F16077B|nr:aldehyde ferredoxin oxidoreductase N-terminal domain-containing protein [Anaerococcus ihuae]